MSEAEAPAAEKGISNILEVVEAVKLVGVTAKKVLKDGKVDLQDVPAVLALGQQHEVLSAAVANIGEVVPEAKDLSVEELAQIGAAALGAVKAIKEA